MIGFVSLLSALAVGCGVSGSVVEHENIMAKQQKKDLEQRVAELERQSNALMRAVETATIAAELMEGVRTHPPSMQVRHLLVYEEAVDKPVRFDGTAVAARDRHVWLKLRPGVQYMCECEVESASLEGARGVKFGGMIKMGSLLKWPACKDSGHAAKGWRRLSFRFELPAGASFMLMYGPNGSKGSCAFRNVRCFEEVVSE